MITKPPDLPAQIERLEYQAATILFLSALNMVMNILTIGISFWIGMS